MKELFEKQQKLDDLIVSNLCKRVQMDITHKQLLSKRLLATFVEIGEFIEEQDHQKKLMESIDIIHFLLSVGLALNIDKCVSKYSIDLLYAKATENNYNEAIKNFIIRFSEFVNVSKVQKYWSVKHEIDKLNLEEKYFKSFMAYFDLCKTMKYSVIDIKTTYESKNKENYKRQAQKY